MVWPTGDPAFTSNRPEVSRCCASHLSCLPKISNQQKGTLSGADASHRFPVLLARPGAAGTRFAQTAGCFIPAVLRCSALRPRGEYSRPSSGKLARSLNYRLLRFVHNQDEPCGLAGAKWDIAQVSSCGGRAIVGQTTSPDREIPHAPSLSR